MTPPEQPTSLRLPVDVLARATRLAERLATDPATVALTGGEGPSRAAILRLAIVRGLEVLEREHGISPPPP